MVCHMGQSSRKTMGKGCNRANLMVMVSQWRPEDSHIWPHLGRNRPLSRHVYGGTCSLDGELLRDTITNWAMSNVHSYERPQLQ